MKRNVRSFVVALLNLLAGTVALAADPTYTVTPLPDFSRATAINNLGDVVGWSSTGRALLLRIGQSQAQEIGTVPGGTTTHPYGVNDNLQIVGESMVNGYMHAFLYSNGVMKDLGTLSGHNQSRATGINSKGQIVGWSQSDTLRLPFLYSRGQMTAIPAIGGLSAWANAINDFGTVVGDAILIELDGTPPTVTRPFVGGVNGVGGLPGLGGNNGQATAISGNGLIVGSEEPILDNPTTHAVAWFSGAGSRPTDLGTLGKKHSIAKGVNKAGQIVGYAYETNDPPESRHAFLYLNGAMYDLNARLATAGWLIREAIAINDAGQIIVEGCYAGATDCGHALLLTPASASRPRRR